MATGMVTDPIEIAAGGGVPENLRALFPNGKPYRVPVEGQQEEEALGDQGGLKDALRRSVIHAPRKLAPGLGGSRFEHWKLAGQVPGGEDHLAIRGANMVAGRRPREGQ